jgi:glycosyltransferase involved in cell wall biosynthesis
MKVAVVHEWIVTYAGSERVLEQILQLYPEADLFCVVDFLSPEERGFLVDRRITTTFIQDLPWAKKKYRSYLPLMPLAIEQLDLSAYELIISSSHAVAKGVLTGPDQLHLCYCHSPMRYAWDLQHQYLRESGLERGLGSLAARYMLHRMRLWDLRTVNGVDHFIAGSRFIARRIAKVYRRSAKVIHPPVDVDAFTPGETREDFYVTASRMVPYKRIDLIVEAFAAMPQRRLIVIGDGPEARRIRAKGASNIQFLGQQPFDVLRHHLRRARAFVFAAEEDFGILPLEAQACGTPVLAYGRGGVLETIRDVSESEPTGVFFREQTVGSLQNAVERFESEGASITGNACRQNALRFSTEHFRSEMELYVAECWKQFQAGTQRPMIANIRGEPGA